MKIEFLILIQKIIMKKLKKFYHRTKDKPKNKTRFSDTTIKGIRDIFKDKLKFYLKESHSDICDKIYKDKSNKDII